MNPNRILPAGLLPAGLFVAGSLMTATPASAHMAPSGWTYPIDCCSNMDCREVSADRVSESPNGYVIEYTGEKISYADTRLRDSPDGVYHWCSALGRNDTRTICLFVPPSSF